MQFREKEFYHLSGRGLGGGLLFKDEQDYARFLFLILHFQSPTRVQTVTFYTNSFLRKNFFPVGGLKIKSILKRRQVELASYVLMPTHFHLLLRNVEEHSVSSYMHRVLLAYGKYFNRKYNRVGHVFDGPYRAIHIKDNNQLLRASCHIHRNPLLIEEWSTRYDEYPYSSYTDYLNQNRWGELLSTNIIKEQFKNIASYRNFVQTHPTKEEDLMLEL